MIDPKYTNRARRERAYVDLLRACKAALKEYEKREWTDPASGGVATQLRVAVANGTKYLHLVVEK